MSTSGKDEAASADRARRSQNPPGRARILPSAAPAPGVGGATSSEADVTDFVRRVQALGRAQRAAAGG